MCVCVCYVLCVRVLIRLCVRVGTTPLSSTLVLRFFPVQWQFEKPPGLSRRRRRRRRLTPRTCRLERLSDFSIHR